jgi:aspartyl aminopeptidase
LKSPDEREAFRVNKEEHLQPLLCDEVEKVLGKTAEKSEGSSGSGDEQKDAWAEVQQSELLTLLAAELGCSVEDIADFELSLFDTQGASVSGLNGEYLCSSRLDNLASCFVSVEALLTHTEGGGLAEDGDVNMIALFDHEEVGSSSGVGAGSTIMRDSVTRISNALHALEDGAAEDSEIFKAALKKSMILSVDMAHAIHPNYASKHDKGHAPRMNSGIVIKSNANQRYMTNGMTGFFVRELARTSGVPVQEFAVRNDCPCGSTIGPIIASNTGIRAVDLGMPQLSMHSIREMMGCSDLTFAHALFVSFFKDFRAVDSGLTSEL